MRLGHVSGAQRNVRRFLAEGSNRTLLGWRELALVHGRLILKSELVESSLDLRTIEKIVHGGNYTYVYISSITAYMIPMNLYPEDEYREFVASCATPGTTARRPDPRRSICPLGPPMCGSRRGHCE